VATQAAIPPLPGPPSSTREEPSSKAASSEDLEGKAKELKGFEKAFMKMDSWMRKRGDGMGPLT
jgi:hypothetical protein